MKKILSISFIFLMMTLIASAKSDDKTVVFTVSPKMSCQNCENKIKSNLRFEKGVKEIVTSLPAQTVTITYSGDKTNPEKIAEGFKKIGYDATIVENNGAACCKKTDTCSHKTGNCCKKANKSSKTGSCCDSKK